ncbi:MAG: AAA family ATPase [Armatimonadetes bacterium]|nr:AAA family ATPase [Armatimonadota bacterium]
MRIRQVHLRNFRGFADTLIPLVEQVTVVAGENGTGKTTVLEALAVAMGGWLSGLPTDEARNLKPQDVRQLVTGVAPHYGLADQYPVSVTAIGDVYGETSVRWIRTLDRPGGRTTTKDATHVRRLAAGASEAVMEGRDITLPVLSHYGPGRLWQEPNDWSQSRRGPYTALVAPQDAVDQEHGNDAGYFARRLSGYRYSVDPRCSEKDLMRWIRLQRLVELDEGVESASLRTVLVAIERCLPVTGLHYSVRHDMLLVRGPNEDLLPFRALSDGYRNVIAMVGDIAFKCSVLNPHLGTDALTKTPGLVLIDEIDLHLHPQWQRRVVEDLRATFPAVQFVATTHSPFIIQSVRPGELVYLGSPPEREYADQSIEDIAEYVMGVAVPQKSERFRHMLEAAEKYIRLLNTPTATGDEIEAAKLDRQEASLPFSDDPAYQAVLRVERDLRRHGAGHAAG